MARLADIGTPTDQVVFPYGNLAFSISLRKGNSLDGGKTMSAEAWGASLHSASETIHNACCPQRRTGSGSEFLRRTQEMTRAEEVLEMAKKSPDSVDVHVGNRIRDRRLALGMSQEKLAGGLGLTFQQVQKYEKGANRVGASRLQAISAILQVPVSFFFEDSPLSSPIRKKAADSSSTDFVTEFVDSADGHTLIRAFMKIKKPVVRRSIVRMVEAVSGSRG